MGAHPYEYFVTYQPDVDAALQELRQREFQAGRYNPAVAFPVFPIGPRSPSLGAQHATIEDALEDSEADGTRSILDLDHVATEPEFGAVVPLDPDILRQLYGTTQPTRAMIEQNMEFLEDVQRGQGVYIIVYKDGRPDEIFFAGYSCDCRLLVWQVHWPMANAEESPAAGGAPRAVQVGPTGLGTWLVRSPLSKGHSAHFLRPLLAPSHRLGQRGQFQRVAADRRGRVGRPLTPFGQLAAGFQGQRDS